MPQGRMTAAPNPGLTGLAGEAAALTSVSARRPQRPTGSAGPVPRELMVATFGTLPVPGKHWLLALPLLHHLSTAFLPLPLQAAPQAHLLLVLKESHLGLHLVLHPALLVLRELDLVLQLHL